MSLPGAHFQKLAALLQNLFFPSRKFARAICSDRRCALLRGLLSLLDRPRSILHPTEYAYDQTPIPGRPKRPSQMAMAVRALLVPVLTIGHCLRPLPADGLQSLDRDVQISHGAELGVEPLQFILYLRPLGVICAFDAGLRGCLCMSSHDFRSNFQDSGAPQLEMRCRTPSLDSVSRWGRGVAAASVRPEKRLYLLISGMATLLFRATGPEPPHNERSGFGIASKSARASRMHR